MEFGLELGGIEVGVTLRVIMVNLLLKLVHPGRLPLLLKLNTLKPIGAFHLLDQLL